MVTFTHLGDAWSAVCRILLKPPRPLLRALAVGLLPSTSAVQRLRAEPELPAELWTALPEVLVRELRSNPDRKTPDRTAGEGCVRARLLTVLALLVAGDEEEVVADAEVFALDGVARACRRSITWIGSEYDICVLHTNQLHGHPDSPQHVV